MIRRASVDGIPETIRALGRFGSECTRRASREVVRAALNIQTDAKRSTPVDTGRLRNSIAVADGEAEAARASAGATGSTEAQNRLSRDTLEAVIGTNVEYAPAVHYGERGRAPRQFLFAPFEAERPRLYMRLRQMLDEEARGAGR